MTRILIKDALNKGGNVELAGWVHNIRALGKIRFLVLRDYSGIIQITGIMGKISEEIFHAMSAISKESVISVKGQLKPAKQAPGGKELIPEQIEIISRAEELPIDVSDRSKTELPKRLDWRCLSLRTKHSSAIFKIQSKIIEGMQEYLNKNNFQQVFTPCLMGMASESGSEVFQVQFFKKKAFLRQDPQLHRQLTILGGIEKLYDIGPSWRAEKSHTVRHLTEHRTCAVEMAFIQDEKDVMRVEEQVIISAFEKVNQDCKNELQDLDIKLNIPKFPFPEINFPEVYEILRRRGSKIKNGDDLDIEDERRLWEYIQEKYPKADFYFLNKFPFKKKPFYVRGEDGSKYARSTDLYYRGIEMSSGGQRENRYDKIIENIKNRKMSQKSVEWFTKFFKFGAPTHGGFAIGIERITMVLLGLSNVREAVLFPRDTERLVP